MLLFDTLMNAVREAARSDELLVSFEKLSTDKDRVEYVESLPCIRSLVVCDSYGQKSEEKAQELLKQDNENSWQAVKGYTSAMKFAPPDSTVVTQSLLGRAHALYRIGCFSEAEEDARRSLKGQLTELEAIKILQIQARCLLNLEQQSEAQSLLQHALQLLRSSTLKNEQKACLTKELVQDIKNTKQTSQKECTKTLSNELPSLDYGENPEIPAASAALELRWTAEKGRHLVAKRDIRIGNVLIVEHPYAWSLSTEALAEHCLHCCRHTTAPLPCWQCSTVSYCTERCREAAWEQYHKFECRVFNHLTLPQDLSKMALLSYRTVVIARLGWTPENKDIADTDGLQKIADSELLRISNKSNDHEIKKPFLSYAYSSVHGQITNSIFRTPSDLLKRAVTAVFLTKCLSHIIDYCIDESMFATSVLHHLQSCSCNAYQISEQLVRNNPSCAVETEIGGAVYPTISLTNHSCNPNAVRYSLRNVCIMRALTNIKIGEEILDNYGPVYLVVPTNERQSLLKKQYFFECNCRACVSKWPTAGELRTLPIHFKCVNCGYELQAVSQGQRTCFSCKRKLDYKKNLQKVCNLKSTFNSIISKLAAGEIKECLNSSLASATILESIVVDPCMELVRWHQIIRLCWSLLGNVVHARD